MSGKMMGRAAQWRTGCRCWDCGGGDMRTNGQQRRRERRAWRRDIDREINAQMLDM